MLRFNDPEYFRYDIPITKSPEDKNFKSNSHRRVSIARVYYPVDIYFTELFGFDGLERSFS